MSDFTAFEGAAPAADGRRMSAQDLPPAGRYLLSLLMVGAAVVLAYAVANVIAAPNLALIFVLPVVIAGSAFGWGPSLLAVAAGVLAFDFFFTEPYFSFRISSPSDIWAAGLLLVIAVIVTTVSAESRRRSVAARRAADQAEALQDFAHVVIEARPQAEVAQGAARALQQIFRAPAVVFALDAGALRRVASAGRPVIAAADEEAARGALADGLHTRAGTYPYDQSRFDFWPAASPSGCDCVIGVDFTRAEAERPDRPERFVDVVGAYLAIALTAGRRGGVRSPPAGSPRRP